MNQDKMQLINKIFNNDTVRTVQDKDSEKYCISVVYIVAILFESKNPKHYLNVLKNKLKEELNNALDIKCR